MHLKKGEREDCLGLQGKYKLPMNALIMQKGKCSVCFAHKHRFWIYRDNSNTWSYTDM